ncbi:unnamed protein product [Prunus brigantina]
MRNDGCGEDGSASLVRVLKIGLHSNHGIPLKVETDYVDPGVFLVKMVAEDIVCSHLLVGQRGSNLREDVLLVPLWMLRKYVLPSSSLSVALLRRHVDVRVRRRDKWGRPTNSIEDNGSEAW